LRAVVLCSLRPPVAGTVSQIVSVADEPERRLTRALSCREDHSSAPHDPPALRSGRGGHQPPESQPGSANPSLKTTAEPAGITGTHPKGGILQPTLYTSQAASLQNHAGEYQISDASALE